jgi:transposase
MTLNPRFQVEVPKTGVVIPKTAKYPYVYHVLRSFRNEKGQPTNEKVSIGKLDAATGMLIPNETYFKYYGDTTVVDVGPAYAGGETFEVGVPFLTSFMFTSLGVDKVLVDALGSSRAARATTVASYMLAEGNVMSYLDEFCERTALTGAMTDRDASRLFSSIGGVERMRFFKGWVGLRRQERYLAYDVTSFSSHSKGLDTEYGYNRDGDSLPQINMAMYLEYQSMLPVFFLTYPGSIVDKSHLPYMMEFNKDLDIEGVSFVMDRGFPSTANLEFMRSEGLPFVAAVETRSKAIRDVLAREGGLLRSSRNRLDDLEVFGTGVKGRYFGVASTLHIYYDYRRKAEQIHDIYRKIASQEEILCQKTTLTATESRKYQKYFTLSQDKDGKLLSYKRNFDQIDKLTNDLGYICLITNSNMPTEEAIKIYKNRNVIEQGFDEIKNHIDMKRLRTHNQETTNGKMFCAFLSLIARMNIAMKLSHWMIENRYTTIRVIRELNKIRAIIGKHGARLLNPLTKKQREILEAFGATVEDVQSYIKAKTS